MVVCEGASNGATCAYLSVPIKVHWALDTKGGLRASEEGSVVWARSAIFLYFS
jgi:hypothetical protein